MSGFAGKRKGEQFGGGIAGAVALHLGLALALVGYGFAHRSARDRWGEQTSSQGAIQASLVNALPLPPKAPPVEKQVLASEETSPAPKPPPKEATQPPPKPTDIQVKAKTPEKKPAKVAPELAPTPPKHPQPTPPTPKAETGESATQIAQSVSQLKNGTSAITVEDRTFGNRYAYYIRGMERTIAQSYDQQDIDARSAQGKRVTVTFTIARDGSLSDIRLATSSGSSSLDTAALRTFQRIDSFNPLPPGPDRENVAWVLQFHTN